MLNFSNFSLQISDHDFMHHLKERITEVTPQRVAELQAGLACVWRFFVWSSKFGAASDESGRDDAFFLMMEELRRRLPGELPAPLPCEGLPQIEGQPALCKAGPDCPTGLAENVPHGLAYTGEPYEPNAKVGDGGRSAGGVGAIADMLFKAMG